jgi:PKD repeat protein
MAARKFLRLLREGIMRADVKSGAKATMMLLALLTLSLFLSSCRTDEPQVPPLTGPSGHRLFITMQAAPDVLVIHQPGRPREDSLITLQLKNQFGTGVSGENVKLRITNVDGRELNIGSLDDYNVVTDAAGFATTTYHAPDQSQQPTTIRIYVLAILTNAAYAEEVTDRHAIDLELSSAGSGDCEDTPGGPTADFTIDPNPAVTNQQICFDATSSSDDGRVVSWDWDFGDGSRSSGEVVCHSYRRVGNYQVTLTVKDNDQNCDHLTQFVDVNTPEPPTCSITANPTNPDIGETVTFQATATSPNGNVVRYTWNFGDGSASRSSSQPIITHAFNSAGVFNVVLTVTDETGGQSVCNIQVSIQGTEPTCVIATTPSPATSTSSPFNVIFDGSGSSGATTLTFNWDFGDGGTGSGSIVPHAYTCTGTAPITCSFIATLTVTDQTGQSSSCTVPVSIDIPAGP